MAKLRLTIATGDYELTRPLKEGEVTAEGLDLVFLTRMGSQEFMGRMIRGREFDVTEIGFNYLVWSVLNGFPEGLTGIPVFPHRRFRHGFIFVNPALGITAPSDLTGRKVGGMYVPTANIWIRGVLQEQYGLPYRSVQWIGERMGPHHLTPDWHEMAGPGERLQDYLVEGKVAALICPDLPPRLVAGDPRIAHMFPNFKKEEIDYYKLTGVYPIMHSLTVKQEIVAKHPWVPSSLFRAFEEAKRLAMQRMADPLIVPLAFYRAYWEEQEALLGPDPWEYGLSESNRKNLGTFVRYMVEQEMIAEAPKLDDMFAPIDPADTTPRA